MDKPCRNSRHIPWRVALHTLLTLHTLHTESHPAVPEPASHKEPHLSPHFLQTWSKHASFWTSNTGDPCLFESPFPPINTVHGTRCIFPTRSFTVSPVLVLNVTTKTDTIWSFSSHFTILSSTNVSVGPKSEGCSTASSLPAGVQGIRGVALQASDPGGPPAPPLHPNPGAEHPEGLDSRSGAASSGLSAGGTSSQSRRGARSDRSIILKQRRRGSWATSQPRPSADDVQIRPALPSRSCSELLRTHAKYQTCQLFSFSFFFFYFFYVYLTIEVIVKIDAARRATPSPNASCILSSKIGAVKSPGLRTCCGLLRNVWERNPDSASWTCLKSQTHESPLV